MDTISAIGDFISPRITSKPISDARRQYSPAEEFSPALIAKYYAELVSKDGKVYIATDSLLNSFERVFNWLTSPYAPNWLVLYGPPGTGKTTLIEAASQAAKACKRASPDKFTALQVNEEAKKSSLRYEALCQDFSLALIDDIGTESPQLNQYGSILTPVKTALEERYTRRLRTILTTNLGPNQIRERYGDRISDRIRDAAIIKFSGDSFRGSR